MSEPIKVLDHGIVRLVSSMASDLAISRSARVSHDAPPREEDEKLINYLMEHRHTTPFESSTFTFEIKAPLFVLRQWHRHRTQSYNELSARYRELPEEFYVPEPWLIGRQNPENKQVRDVITEAEFYRLPQRERATMIFFSNHIKQANLCSFQRYKELLRGGVPRELARSVLPVGTYSHMFTTMNLHNLFHFLELRLHAHAQYEIRVYAEAMFELIKPLVPIAAAAFEKRISN